MLMTIFHALLIIVALLPWILVLMYLLKKILPNVGAIILNPFVKKKELEDLMSSYQISHKYAPHYRKKYKGIDKGAEL